jgi:uncharacterized membrane protein
MQALRDWLEQARSRLLFLPAVFTVVGFLGALAMVSLDQFVIDGDDLPRGFRTSVDGGRAVLSTIATGLITAYTLVLSLLLIAVQLASSQVSPRSLRNWLGDRTLQRALAMVLATVVFCLVVLYHTRDFGDDSEAFEPHVSVLVAIALALTSLVVVLRSVDHLADSMRINSVAKNIMHETVDMVRSQQADDPVDRPGVNPATRPVHGMPAQPPPGAHIVESTTAAWVQTIDLDALLDACPDGCEAHVPIAVGSFTLSGAPLLWVAPAPEDPEDFDERIRDAIALGDIRTLQQDVSFGIVRLVDIALHALSPSLNDANSAKDVISHLGEVVLAILEKPERSGHHNRQGRRLTSTEYSHREYVHAAFDEIRRNAVEHPQVLMVLLRTLLTVRQEVQRRDLPASFAVIDELVREILEDVQASTVSNRDRQRVMSVIPPELRHLLPEGPLEAVVAGRG